MAPGEFRQGVGLGLGAKFLNDRLDGPGPQSPLGTLHSQEQCFIKTGKIIEKKCTCKEAGIYRNGPASTQSPRMIWGVGTQRGHEGAESSWVRPFTAHSGLGSGGMAQEATKGA